MASKKQLKIEKHLEAVRKDFAEYESADEQYKGLTQLIGKTRREAKKLGIDVTPALSTMRAQQDELEVAKRTFEDKYRARFPEYFGAKPVETKQIEPNEKAVPSEQKKTVITYAIERVGSYTAQHGKTMPRAELKRDVEDALRKDGVTIGPNTVDNAIGRAVFLDKIASYVEHTQRGKRSSYSLPGQTFETPKAEDSVEPSEKEQSPEIKSILTKADDMPPGHTVAQAKDVVLPTSGAHRADEYPLHQTTVRMQEYNDAMSVLRKASYLDDTARAAMEKARGAINELPSQMKGDLRSAYDKQVQRLTPDEKPKHIAPEETLEFSLLNDALDAGNEDFNQILRHIRESHPTIKNGHLKSAIERFEQQGLISWDRRRVRRIGGSIS